MDLLVICIFFFQKCLLEPIAYFKIRQRFPLTVLYLNSLSDRYFANIYSQFPGCLFIFCYWF